MSDWDKVSFQNENRVRLDEIVKIVDYRKSKSFKSYRFIGPLQKIAEVRLPIYKDGKPILNKNGDPLTIPFNATNFDPETETFDETKECPFVKAAEAIRKYIKDDREAKQISLKVNFIAQAISRDLQENPEKKGKPSKKERQSGFKESIDSDSATPVECHRLNFSIGQGLESAKETNTVLVKQKDGSKKKVSKSVADPKYGRDIMIKYDEKAQGVAKYKVQPGERTPLNEGDYDDEDKYLLWNIVAAIQETTMTPKEAKVEADRLIKEFMKSIKKKSSSDEDEDEDEDLPEDIEESDKPKKNGKKTSKKPKDEDEDEEEDEDLDLEDEDEENGEEEEEKKSKKSGKKTGKAKVKPKKSGKKKKDEEEEDEDEEDDEDDEDIEIDLDDDED